MIDEAPKVIRAERYARKLESPVVKGATLHLDCKCSVCLVWVYRDDNYCANCGAKFDKEEKKRKCITQKF